MSRKYDKPERARRYAKTIASDIKLYNMKALEKALMEDNVFEANRAEGSGGALILWNLTGGRAEVRRNLFVANESTIQGYYV
ncbi:hypothetical protein KJ865_14960, partial [Myxococcota bacterium]|nr:hypothetical protein [Myxococcota bacterium]